MAKDVNEYFEDEENVIEETEELGFFGKVWKGVKEHPLQVMGLLGTFALGATAAESKYKKELKKQEKVNDTLIEESYNKGRVDGVLEVYDKIIFSKEID